MILILAVVLLILMILIGGDRGAKSFIALVCNIIALISGIYLIISGVNPILVTILGTIVFCQITLIYQNGHNMKTYAAVISVICVILLLSFIIYFVGNKSNFGGYSELDLSSDISVYLSPNVNINMNQLMICMIIVSLLGAIMDTAMAITSSLFEFNEINSEVTTNTLIKMGFNVGRDILGTTVNTLFFATIGETMMISILFMKNNNTFSSVINSKEFFQNLFSLAISNIGCLFIIPISIFIGTYMLKGNNEIIKKIKVRCDKLERENNG